MTETVGLIGVGAMGSALLERLRKAGHSVQAYDIVPQAVEAAVKAGARAAASPAAAATGASKVHVFVRTDEEVEAVTLGKDGALAGMTKGALLILHSTILPQTTKRVAEQAARRGVDVIDVPITSVPPRVRDGKAAMLVGGPAAIVERERAYLQSLGGAVYVMGPLGSGNVAKLAKNAMNAAERVIFAEMLRLATEGGLKPQTFLDMIKAEHHGSVVSDWHKALELDGDVVAMKPVSNLLDKDLPLAAELGRQLSLDLTATTQAANTGRKLLAAWTQDWRRSGRATH